jgi:hypothetical protein
VPSEWGPASRASRCPGCFQGLGVVYGLVAVLGFFYGSEPILGILANNRADAWLHLGIAAVSLYLGFAPAKASALAAVR